MPEKTILRYGFDPVTKIMHLNGACGAGYTLCGLADEDDDFADVRYLEHRHRGPVTCEDCIQIILHCRGVRVSSRCEVQEEED